MVTRRGMVKAGLGYTVAATVGTTRPADAAPPIVRGRGSAFVGRFIVYAIFNEDTDDSRELCVMLHVAPDAAGRLALRAGRTSGVTIQTIAGMDTDGMTARRLLEMLADEARTPSPIAT